MAGCERNPGRDVGFVVAFGEDDFAAGGEGEGEGEVAEELGCGSSEDYFVWLGVDVFGCGGVAVVVG